MIVLFTIAIDYSKFQDIESAPKDGRIIYLMDVDGSIDLATWSLGEWSTEYGNIETPMYWADFHLSRPQQQ